MSTEYPTLAEVLLQHTLSGAEGILTCWCGERFVEWDEHAAHFAEAWREVRMISTVEQLDALPIGSVVRTTEERVAVKTGERWGNQSGHGSWWSVADEDEFDLSSDELDDLPALLIFHPDWSK